MTTNYPGYTQNNAAFFDILMEGLKGEVPDGSFWDAVSEDAIFEFEYRIPDFPSQLSKSQYFDWFKTYPIRLRADHLRVYKDAKKDTVIIEYEVHGRDGQYNNRFCSIVTLKNHQIVYWRDYGDSLQMVN